jgi:hypothetical protein
MSVRLSLIAASVSALALMAGTSPALAQCKTMGFTVNDYGKDGPTNDAKELLDKEIAKWAADNGVDKYTVGKKTVKCELFLDVILFDEHTCTASASVCWGASATPPAKSAKKESAAKPASSTAATDEKPPVETGAIDKSTPVKEIKDDKPAAAAAPEQKSQSAAKPDASNDAAERAAAAAERAAAAAERAAAAAEKAASGSGPAATASSSDAPKPDDAGEEGPPKL